MGKFDLNELGLFTRFTLESCKVKQSKNKNKKKIKKIN